MDEVSKALRGKLQEQVKANAKEAIGKLLKRSIPSGNFKQ
jgi:hypothetical protein